MTSKSGFTGDVPKDDSSFMEWKATLEDRAVTNSSASPGHDGTSEDVAPSEVEKSKHSLDFSGRVISAVFCIPYKIRYGEDGEWLLEPRRGTSALFDALAYLSSTENQWQHTIVGWTGEIEKTTKTHPQARPKSQNRHSMPPFFKRQSKNPHGDDIFITQADRTSLETQLQHDTRRISPVWLADGTDSEDNVAIFSDQARWRRYAEQAIYTLFHYKQQEPSDGKAEQRWWSDYQKLNKVFADRILETYQPGDIIWVHDYHLLLLPSLLRQALPDAHIVFFLHIPFPSSEYLRCLGKRKEILEGMLGSNLIAFQSYSYSRHFVSCCKRILRFESSPAGIDAYGARVTVDVFPIGIDASGTEHLAYDDPMVEKKMTSLRERYDGKKIIVGRDRLDSVRGVAQKLQAFEIFLKKYPQWRNQVVLIQVTSPTSVGVENEESATKIANKVADLVSRINGVYGSLSFSPVQHYTQYISKEEYFGLLRIADLGLITSVRDGMNSTSLEYVVCQRENHGPLIISEFSGTAGSLSNALHINPWDLSGVARCIDHALRLNPEEKKDQHDKLYNYITSHDVRTWTNKILEKLKTVISSLGQAIATPALDRSILLISFRKSKKRLFMFDYDGTLTPIVKDPQSAIPTDRVIRTLKTLSSDPRNHVWIISGRDQAFLDDWMGHIPELGLSAEHGCFLRYPMAEIWENVTEKADMTWQEQVIAVFQRFTETTQGSFVERKKVALTWHYRKADPEHGAFQAQECRKVLEETVVQDYDVEVMAGKANLEVRPRFVNKGEIAKRLLAEYGNVAAPGTVSSDSASGPDFVLCLGDDFTDEDMFGALKESKLPPSCIFACTVGPSSKQTLASWHLLEPHDVIATIGMLNDCDTGDGNDEKETD